MRIIIIVAASLFISGCCSSGRTSCPPESVPAPAPAGGNLKSAPATAGISMNSARIKVSIDSVDLAGEYDFRLFVEVVGEELARTENVTPDLGKYLEIKSDFDLDEKQFVDRSSPRNKRLLKLRSAKPGDTHTMRVSRGRDGTLYLLDLDE